MKYHRGLLEELRTLRRVDWDVLQGRCNLTDEQKEALFLRYTLDKSCVAISLQMNVNEKKVTAYVKHGLGKIERHYHAKYPIQTKYLLPCFICVLMGIYSLI